MNFQSFVVAHRPRLAEITEHPQMDFADYERRRTSLQGAHPAGVSRNLGAGPLLVPEGWDTAGKGGLVRRLGWALDPRSFKVHPIGAPDEHERAQHYLQRFCVRPVLVWTGGSASRRNDGRDSDGLVPETS
jgi:polyphosphate kinase 2 (PPK2 family)